MIGDIHGCLDELAYLIEGLPLEPGDRLVFLGDYVDRGPDSRGVLTYILDLQKRDELELICLKGNHEDMFMAYLGLPGQHGDMFLYNGGLATLSSYGVNPRQLSSDDILAQIAAEHIEFLKSLKRYFVIESFIFVHAGIHPLKPLEKQTDSDLLWIRNEFISHPHRLPYTVVFGHTPRNSVLFDLPYKIGLDTGLVYGNKLSCLEIVDRSLYQISRGQKQVKRFVVADRWSR
ncbi:MAG: metallophosphoesterase family protein [Candidatus Binatia bacterium]